MTAEKIQIEVDSSFIQNFFGLADEPAPDEVNLATLNTALDKIKRKLVDKALSSSEFFTPEAADKPAGDYLSGGMTESSNKLKTVLIVDDLGIITYQLDILFKKMGYEVTISQEIYDAIDKFKKQDFGYAVIDLFIPTEREGFILLDELKKLALLCKLNTKIIVMTASSKAEYQDKCTNRGANHFIEKSPGWQKKIMEACMKK